MKIIGFAGAAGSGKSYGAQVAVDVATEAGYRADIVSFATPIRVLLSALAAYAGWDVDTTSQRGKAEQLADTGVTVRHALQTLGVEWGRDLISPTLWLDVARDHIRSLEADGCTLAVIDDVRFPDELDFVRQHGHAIHLRADQAPSCISQHRSEAVLPVGPQDACVLNTYTPASMYAIRAVVSRILGVEDGE